MSAPQFYRSGEKVLLFLKTSDIPNPPMPTPTPNNIGGGFTVTSWNDNNGWLTSVNDCYMSTPEGGTIGCPVGFGACSGCGPGGTEIILLYSAQNYQRNFSVTVSGSSTATYQWQVRTENANHGYVVGWSGWTNAPESHEFTDVNQPTLRWTYNNELGDRKLSFRCIINDTFFTKPIYLRYNIQIGGGYMHMNSSKNTYRHLI